jgi:hypothetical protein
VLGKVELSRLSDSRGIPVTIEDLDRLEILVDIRKQSLPIALAIGFSSLASPVTENFLDSFDVAALSLMRHSRKIELQVEDWIGPGKSIYGDKQPGMNFFDCRTFYCL